MITPKKAKVSANICQPVKGRTVFATSAAMSVFLCAVKDCVFVDTFGLGDIGPFDISNPNAQRQVMRFGSNRAGFGRHI